MKNYDGPAHGHKFAKLKPTNHQKFSNSLKLYTDDVRYLSLEKQLEKEISQMWEKDQDIIITLLEGMGEVKVISAKANV